MEMIAKIDPCPDDDDRRRRLLIAAPRLLATCKEVRDSLLQRMATEGDGGTSYFHELSLLNAAIASAT